MLNWEGLKKVIHQGARTGHLRRRRGVLQKIPASSIFQKFLNRNNPEEAAVDLKQQIDSYCSNPVNVCMSAGPVENITFTGKSLWGSA